MEGDDNTKKEYGYEAEDGGDAGDQPEDGGAAITVEPPKSRRLDTATERELFESARAGDAAAREDLFLAAQRLVFKIASRFHSFELSRDDLIQEGNLALLKAIDGFDSSRGTRLSTFAYTCIEHALSRAIRKARCLTAATVVVSGESDGGGNDESRDDINNGCPVYVHIDPDDLPGPPVYEPFADSALGPEEREAIKALVQALPSRQRDVIVRRYGFDCDGEAHSLREVGATLHMSRETVRLAEREAIAALRRVFPGRSGK